MRQQSLRRSRNSTAPSSTDGISGSARPGTARHGHPGGGSWTTARRPWTSGAAPRNRKAVAEAFEAENAGFRLRSRIRWNFGCRGARLARREERAYRQYATDEQRRQAGWIGDQKCAVILDRALGSVALPSRDPSSPVRRPAPDEPPRRRPDAPPSHARRQCRYLFENVPAMSVATPERTGRPSDHRGPAPALPHHPRLHPGRDHRAPVG